MKKMEIKVEDEIRDEFGRFILRLLEQIPELNVRCTNTANLFFLPLPDGFDENLIRERVIQKYGSRAKVRMVSEVTSRM